jgi:diguanylate cyclase (GGDEF)-like protein
VNDDKPGEPADDAASVVAETLLMPTVLRACAYAFAMGALMDSITLATSNYATNGVRATYVVMITCYLGFLLQFKVNSHRLLTDERYAARFVRTAWSVVACGLIVRMGIALFTTAAIDDIGDAVLSVFVGLIVLYLLAFILVDKGQATAASALILGISAVLVTVRFVGDADPVTLEHALPYVRAYGVHVIVVAYCYVLARTKEMLSESHNATTALTVKAGTDELTGLANRRQLGTALDREIALSRRQLTPLAVVLVDIDRFKAVNDTYGHAAGDDVLQGTADVLRQATRDADLVGRWGGEEFLLLLPTADADVAALVAERCRASLADHDFPVVSTVTASFGVALLADDDDADALVARADEALYRAKGGGRDRVEVAAAPVGTPSSPPPGVTATSTS